MPKADNKNLLKVAQILKSNGAKGELVLGFKDISPEDLNIEEPVFIYFDGLLVPYFIDSFGKRGTKKALVHLTDIESEEDTAELIGKEIYIEDDGEFEEEDNSFEMLIGWTLFNDGKNNQPPIKVGIINDFLDIPNNPCLDVEIKNGAVLIPLHEDLILSVDTDNQEIIMSLPDGLLQ